jgi:hypothetical protein
MPLGNFITGDLVCAFPHLFTPQSPFRGGIPVYSVCAIIDKVKFKSTADAIMEEIRRTYAANNAKLAGHSGVVPPLDSIKIPLHDGDVERPGTVFKSSFYLNAKKKTPPGVVDASCQPITDPSQIYSGCIVRLSLSFFAYVFGPNRGIGVSLNNVQKVADAPRLAGGMQRRPEDDFKPIISTENFDFLA